MKEKWNWNHWMNEKYRYASGYFKPKGKYAKRSIHKEFRRKYNRYYGHLRDGIMKATGVCWEWS